MHSLYDLFFQYNHGTKVQKRPMESCTSDLSHRVNIRDSAHSIFDAIEVEVKLVLGFTSIGP